MKTFTTIASALVLMSTVSASAATVGDAGKAHWTGSKTLLDMCQFTQNDTGEMNLDAANKVWKADTIPSKVTIAYRGVDKILVEADNSKRHQTSHQYAADGSLIYGFDVDTGNGVIHGHEPGKTHGEVFDAAVEYGGSTYKTTQDGGKETNVTTVAASSGSFEVAIPNSHSYGEEFSGVASIEIRGTATPTGVAIYYSDDEYHVPHKITCVQ
jgi:hypothetical protein